MVFAAPELVVAQPIEIGDEIEIALELQGGALTEGVMGGEKSAEAKAWWPHWNRLRNRSHRQRPGERRLGGAILRLPSGDVAQLAERYLCKVDVEGSIPFVSTR